MLQWVCHHSNTTLRSFTKLKQRVDNHKLEIVKNIYRDQRYATRSGRYAVAAMDRSRHCFLGEGSILGHHRSMA
jgi:hypothetical protein